MNFRRFQNTKFLQWFQIQALLSINQGKTDSTRADKISSLLWTAVLKENSKEKSPKKTIRW